MARCGLLRQLSLDTTHRRIDISPWGYLFYFFVFDQLSIKVIEEV